MLDSASKGALPSDVNGTENVSPVAQDRFGAEIAQTFGPRSKAFSRAYTQLKTIQKLASAHCQMGVSLHSDNVGLWLVDVVKNARPSQGAKDVNPDRQLILSAWIAARVCAFSTIKTLVRYAEGFIPDLKKGDDSLVRACVAISHKVQRGVFYDELEGQDEAACGGEKASAGVAAGGKVKRTFIERNPGSEEILVGFWGQCASEIQNPALRGKVTQAMQTAIVAAKPDLDSRLVLTARLFSQTKNEEIVASFGGFVRDIFDEAARKGCQMRDGTLAEACWSLASNVTKVDRGKGIRKSFARFWERCATAIQDEELRGQVARSMYLATAEDSPAHHAAEALLTDKKKLYVSAHKSAKAKGGNKKPQTKGKKQTSFRPERGLPRLCRMTESAL